MPTMREVARVTPQADEKPRNARPAPGGGFGRGPQHARREHREGDQHHRPADQRYHADGKQDRHEQQAAAARRPEWP